MNEILKKGLDALRNCMDMADYYKPIEIDYRGPIQQEVAYELSNLGYSIQQSGVGSFKIRKIGV